MFGFIGNFILEIEKNLNEIFFGQNILISIALVLIFAALIAFVFKLFRQEFILAYVVAGIILGPLVLGFIQDKEVISVFAEIGITFLLFIVGLEMNLRKLKKDIGTSILAGLIQVFSIVIVSFFILLAFKFSIPEAIWIGVAIAFSSTVVVTKILSDKNELNTLHARFIIGIMLIQDIMAIIALAILTKNFTFTFLFYTLIKLVFLVFIAFLLNLLAKFTLRKAATSTELLFVVSLAFLFFLVLLTYFLKISVAIGAFIAGVILANTPYKLEIESKTKALKDFFSIIFFVSVGMLLTNISKNILMPLIPLLFVLIVLEPLVTALVLRIKGYKTKTSLQIGLSFAQLSEFSLILVLTALSLGVISQRAFDLIVLIAVISIAVTPYTMKLDGLFNKLFGGIFNLINVKLRREEGYLSTREKTILLFGCHRMGSIYLKNLQEFKDKFVVVDFNPEIIKSLANKKISCIYGDISDYEFIQNIPLQKIKIAISTLPKKDENVFLIKCLKEKNKNIFIAAIAEKIHDALELYEAGADYVILPMIIGAEQSIKLIKDLTKKDFKKLKKEHIAHLKEIHKLLY